MDSTGRDVPPEIEALFQLPEPDRLARQRISARVRERLARPTRQFWVFGQALTPREFARLCVVATSFTLAAGLLGNDLSKRQARLNRVPVAAGQWLEDRGDPDALTIAAAALEP